jgi:hypothetical protein
MKNIILSVIFVSILYSLLFALDNERGIKPKLNKSLVINDVRLDINRMNGVFRNNGIWYHDVVTRDWGLEWPKGSGLSPVFAAGQLIGARVNGNIRIAGVQYIDVEFQPGVITEPFVSDDPADDKYRWYYIEPGNIGDWRSWPVDQGAPVDNEGNPLLLGDHTLYCVWNDLAEHVRFGTEPLSVEVHQTVFAFNRINELGDMQFMKWLLVNKSGLDWDSTYFSIFIDADIGHEEDDLVGCDTLLNLGFCYNASDTDQNYGTNPPAIGVDLLQGPLIDKAGSNVTLPNGTILTGKEMIKMTSFVFYNNEDTPQGNPQTGEHAWNYLRGRWRDGSLITLGERGTNPANPLTTFVFSGDPETAAGWLDSDEADRRFLMNSGPFPMKAWDDENNDGQPAIGEPGVQEIVACIMVARGTTNLNSVTQVKQMDVVAQSIYDTDFLTDRPSEPITIPHTYTLYQNYPNPFNPKTVIRYALPVTSHIDLSIYNLLGQKVVTLVDKEQAAGSYQVSWDATGFTSGVYFYQLGTNKGFVQTKKLLLLR